jgi:coenzyme F420 hydrogenase subunit beta
MISLPVRNVTDVAERQLCCGCGACSYVRPGEIEMVDTLKEGRRPRVRAPLSAAASEEGMRVCPGVRLAHPVVMPEGADVTVYPGWGPVLKTWEGHAGDAGLRWAGSSGGAASALGLYAIERAGMHGVLHIRARNDVPYLNRTVLSTTREDLLRGTGSRYAPASPCDGLGMVETAPGPCLMIGKPCDVAAARLACDVRPALGEKLAITVAFFCAGTPSTQGTLELLKRMGVKDPAAVKSVRYRGNGWPGKATIEVRTERGVETLEATYEDSWGNTLQKYRQWRCYVCADHTGEFADISVGDPWYRPIAPGEAGTSLIIARTPAGLRFVEEAIASGHLVAKVADAEILPRSQPNLLSGRGAVWGRTAMLRLVGMAAPRYLRMPMARWWWSELSAKEKAQSFYGTFRRIFTKELWKRRRVEEWSPR